MAKKERDLLICYCRSKRRIGKLELVEGTKCFCQPYPIGKKPGTTYKTVIVH